MNLSPIITHKVVDRWNNTPLNMKSRTQVFRVLATNSGMKVMKHHCHLSECWTSNKRPCNSILSLSNRKEKKKKKKKKKVVVLHLCTKHEAALEILSWCSKAPEWHPTQKCITPGRRTWFLKPPHEHVNLSTRQKIYTLHNKDMVKGEGTVITTEIRRASLDKGEQRILLFAEQW